MANIEGRKRLKIILVPFPAQGHVTPMLKLASAFLNKGLEPLMVIPEFVHQRITSNIDSRNEISCMSIPDGLDKEAPPDFFAIEKAMENNMPIYLESLIHKLNEDGGRVVCVVVDLLASWAIPVADRCGIPAAGFWPVMLAAYRLITAIPDMVRTGLISDSTGCPQHLEEALLLPNQPALSTEDLPWLIGTPSARKSRFKFWIRTLDRSRTLRWLLVNSFPEEYIGTKHQYDHYLNSGNSQPRVYLVGPLSQHAKTRNPSFWEEDMSCLEWLDKQRPNSVVYVSFGSWVSPIGEAKVKNIALALEASGLPFIWVLASTWREGLPTGYLERVSKKSKVVSWAPQMKVLQHKAVACFLTHCGWNSTTEAIQCQKRLLCYPIAGDQFVNCAYIVKAWKIGVKINGFGQKDIEEGLKRVMDEKDSDGMKKRLTRLHMRTTGEDARSRVIANLTAFVDDLNNVITANNYHLSHQ